MTGAGGDRESVRLTCRAPPHIMGIVKAFLVVCALAGAALAVATSCGPERPFCPNNPPEFNCINNSDAGSIGGGGAGGSSCTMTIFICNGQSHCGPCT
jgi:hypothetical protein